MTRQWQSKINAVNCGSPCPPPTDKRSNESEKRNKWEQQLITRDVDVEIVKDDNDE